MLSQQTIDTFWNALGVTVEGMTGIFIFMGIFYLTIIALDKLFPYKSEEEENN